MKIIFAISWSYSSRGYQASLHSQVVVANTRAIIFLVKINPIGDTSTSALHKMHIN